MFLLSAFFLLFKNLHYLDSSITLIQKMQIIASLSTALALFFTIYKIWSDASQKRLDETAKKIQVISDRLVETLTPANMASNQREIDFTFHRFKSYLQEFHDDSPDDAAFILDEFLDKLRFRILPALTIDSFFVASATQHESNLIYFEDAIKEKSISRINMTQQAFDFITDDYDYDSFITDTTRFICACIQRLKLNGHELQYGAKTLRMLDPDLIIKIVSNVIPSFAKFKNLETDVQVRNFVYELLSNRMYWLAIFVFSTKVCFIKDEVNSSLTSRPDF